jgi:hypothetical protein
MASRKFYKVEDYFDHLPLWMQERAYVVRELILGSNRNIVESMKYNVPFYTYEGYLFYLGTYKKTQLVLAFCNGVHVPDEHGLLRADAKQTQLRHWPLLQDQEPDYELLAHYIELAIEVNKNLKTSSFGIKTKTITKNKS